MLRDTRSPRRDRRGLTVAPLLGLLALLLAVVVFVVFSNRRVPEGPVPVIWDKTPCAQCAMHLGDPRFAAQLTTGDGDTHFYDDPGCLFLHRRALLDSGAAIHAAWFRDMTGDAWLAIEEVAFLHTDSSPMDFGFGAVRSGGADSVTLAEAEREFLKR